MGQSERSAEELLDDVNRQRARAEKAEERLIILGRAVERHLAIFGYDNHEGLADALAEIDWTDA